MNNMPPITKNLIIINLLFFFAKIVATRYGIDLNEILGLHFFLASDFRLFQFVSYMFMHGGFEHILFNMFAVWMFGRIMENVWGPRRFLIYYMVCGIGAGFVQEAVQYVSYITQGLDEYDNVLLNGIAMPTAEYLNYWKTVGASGAVYGILLAFGMTFPNERLFIFPLPVPIKAKFFVIGYAGIELWSALANSNDGIAHFAHLGGMIFGLFLIMHWRNNGGAYYGGKSSSDKIKDWFRNRMDKFSSARRSNMKVNMGKRGKDYDYNAKKKAQSEEIDAILEKVKRSGYNSLTEEEKRKLFDASQR